MDSPAAAAAVSCSLPAAFDCCEVRMAFWETGGLQDDDRTVAFFAAVFYSVSESFKIKSNWLGCVMQCCKVTLY